MSSHYFNIVESRSYIHWVRVMYNFACKINYLSFDIIHNYLWHTSIINFTINPQYTQQVVDVGTSSSLCQNTVISSVSERIPTCITQWFLDIFCTTFYNLSMVTVTYSAPTCNPLHTRVSDDYRPILQILPSFPSFFPSLLLFIEWSRRFWERG